MSKMLIEIIGLHLNTVSAVKVENKKLFSMPIAPVELVKGLEIILDALDVENIEIRYEK